MIQLVLESIFKELDKSKKGKIIIENFVGSINEIKFPGIGISLQNKPGFVRNVRNNFSDFLLNITGSLKDYNGLFLIIDDINGLSKTPEFPNWYKGLSETIDFSGKEVPVAFTLVSYRENFDKLTEHNTSFSRIFHYIEIDHLDDDDIRMFFKENSLNQMVYYSWGMPLAMQQIREETFWNVKNSTIDEDIAFNGILNAAVEIGNKQIRLILDQIEDDSYENILLKLGEAKLIQFHKSELINLLSDDEVSIAERFLSHMIELNILEHVGKKLKDEYTFTNRLYFVYFLIIANLKLF